MNEEKNEEVEEMLEIDEEKQESKFNNLKPRTEAAEITKEERKEIKILEEDRKENENNNEKENKASLESILELLLGIQVILIALFIFNNFTISDIDQYCEDHGYPMIKSPDVIKPNRTTTEEKTISSDESESIDEEEISNEEVEEGVEDEE